MKKLLYAFLLVLSQTALADFSVKKFELSSVKNISWSEIASGFESVQRAEKTNIPVFLYTPATVKPNSTAVVLMHGIGGLYNRYGEQRIYFEYAEMLANQGITVLVIDSHSSRGMGVANQTTATNVTVHTFVADVYNGLEYLKSLPHVNKDKIGLMGFSKGGLTTILATETRYRDAVSPTKANFAFHIPIYPGCQTFTKNPKLNGSPMLMLLGEKDNYTGLSGCYEIQKIVPNTEIVVLKDATHSWDEKIYSPIKINDGNSDLCRWKLDDSGLVYGGEELLSSSQANVGYIQKCLKKDDIYVVRNDAAFKQGKELIVKFINSR
jgi:dienelactone hydrolase